MSNVIPQVPTLRACFHFDSPAPHVSGDTDALIVGWIEVPYEDGTTWLPLAVDEAERGVRGSVGPYPHSAPFSVRGWLGAE